MTPGVVELLTAAVPTFRETYHQVTHELDACHQLASTPLERRLVTDLSATLEAAISVLALLEGVLVELAEDGHR